MEPFACLQGRLRGCRDPGALQELAALLAGLPPPAADRRPPARPPPARFESMGLRTWAPGQRTPLPWVSTQAILQPFQRWVSAVSLPTRAPPSHRPSCRFTVGALVCKRWQRLVTCPDVLRLGVAATISKPADQILPRLQSLRRCEGGAGWAAATLPCWAVFVPLMICWSACHPSAHRGAHALLCSRLVGATHTSLCRSRTHTPCPQG